MPIVDDTLDEQTETFQVVLSDTSGSEIRRGLGTILDNDAAPMVSIGDVSVLEGNAGTTNAAFTLTLSAPSGQTVTVIVDTADGTATAPVDYGPVTGQVVTFAPGATIQTVVVPVIGDLLDEADEVFLVNLSAPVNITIADGQGVGTILDDDAPPSLSINDVTVAEGAGTASFTVTLSAASGLPITVSFATAPQSATEPGDYTGTSGTLTFLPGGPLTQTISVPIVDDALFENPETFLVNLTAPANASIADGVGVGTITDNDPAPTITITAVTTTEGDVGTSPAAFVVTLSAPAGVPVTVRFATADGSAIASLDYQSVAGVLTFAPGETAQTIVVPIVGDLLDEPQAETFTLALSSPTNGTLATTQVTGTILDDDAPPSISVADASVVEGDSGTVLAQFLVSLSAPSEQVVTIAFATAGQSATAGADYTETAGTLTFQPGQTSQTVLVPVAGDILDEADETFRLTLSAPGNATLADPVAIGTILDDDAPPSLSINDVTVAEGAGTASFTVTLSAASGLPITVSFATAPQSATEPGDYTGTSGTLTFLPGGPLTQTISVPIVDDALFENPETFLVNLTAPTNASIADGVGVGTITDNDPAPTITVTAVTTTEGDVGTSPAAFVVTLSAPAGVPVTVRFATADGSAIASLDYHSVAGVLTFAPGETAQTVVVPIVGDLLDEPQAETFTLALSSPTNGTLATTR